MFIPFLFTALAGLCTGIGGLIALYSKRMNTSYLAFSLGLSAGVMIYVSFVELFPGATESLEPFLGSWAEKVTTFCFYAGIVFIACIDRLIPSVENPHEFDAMDDFPVSDNLDHKPHLLRLGTFTAVAIAIHNFPEGLATFASTLQNTDLGFSIAVAVAIHNIPEGIAVAVPIYYATGSKKKAFWYSTLSGLAEPLGAILGYFFLHSLLGEMTLGVSFAFVSGIMVFICLDQLLPAAERYGEHHPAIYGVITGMVLMAVSLLLL